MLNDKELFAALICCTTEDKNSRVTLMMNNDVKINSEFVMNYRKILI